MKAMKQIVLTLFLGIAAFMASGQNSMMVITPNGGENWLTGCPNQIQWITPATSMFPVKIELYRNGLYYLTICNQVPAGQSAYSWTPPYTVIPGNTYKVKVSSLTGSLPVFDFSDNNFTISPGQNTGIVTVVNPNGGENWIIGCPALIEWVTPATITAPVRIELYRNNLFYMTLCSQAPPGQGSFTWIPPWTILPGNMFKVKVSLLTSSGTASGYDFSDGFFSITRGSITVTSPNGGESWAKGTVHPVTWTDDLCGNVRLELWKGGVFHSLIAPSVPSSGFFNWVIPNSPSLVPGNNYRVRVAAAINATTANAAVFDISDGDFSILAASAITGTGTPGFKVYPNPFANLVSIDLPEGFDKPLSVRITGIDGAPVLGKDIFTGEAKMTHSLNTSSLPEGRYLMILESGGKVVFSRVIILSR